LKFVLCPDGHVGDVVCLPYFLALHTELCGVLLNYIVPVYVSGFIGYASTFHQVVADHAIEDVEDDQLYYTKLFLDKQKRVC